ncbi:putative transcriptional regulatory protein C3C7.04 [Grifola frondosa]|uniref:Putative transcriptional regulatory protein C3C7.04 n=1 Tax=Grifola frondosa TaxID=5627 RepID=A0A1C7LRE4_GRIFR|nr:putative transcriptional regulatory protein C3C7.04 [Grifola frondosa]
MQRTDIYHWTSGPSTAVIDLVDPGPFDLSNDSTAVSPYTQSYYALDSSAEGNGSKKRKVERACDFCRKRKTKCDGPRMAENVCTNCIQNGRSCTYLEGSKPRGPPKAYVVALEDRMERMEALLKRLRPESDFSTEIGPPSTSPSHADMAPSLTRNQSLVSLAVPPPNGARPRATTTTAAQKGNRTVRRQKSGRLNQTRNHSDTTSGSSSEHDSSSSSLSGSSDNEDFGELSLVRGMKRLTVRGLEPTECDAGRDQPADNQWRFHGKSSSFKLIHTARELMQLHMDALTNSSGHDHSISPPTGESDLSTTYRRPEFWKLPPWEISFEHADGSIQLPSFLVDDFPPLDLAESLIELYFTHNNDLFPLLHHPTFERQWRDGLHKRDLWFNCVCWAMFGVGSRWSTDPRVLPSKVSEQAGDDEGMWTLAGWKYTAIALQVHECRRSVLMPPNLFEVQTFALIGQYLRGTVAQYGSWFYLSVGIRKAQDVGAHRRKIYGRKPTTEEELWKRAYWHLVAFDRIGSMLIGRPCCSREDDLDIDLPLEPEGVPSKISAFVCWIKLSQIAAFALSTLYTPLTAKTDTTITRLNDAMLDWIRNLPAHLRWSPTMENRIFASQAATLHTTYHLVQILVYRPFISVRHAMPRGSLLPQSYRKLSDRPSLSSTALSICVNSAKAAAHILEIQVTRGMSNITNVIHVSFVCTGVLLVHLWDMIGRELSRAPLSSPDEQAQTAHAFDALMGEISNLVDMLEEASVRWELARDMLDEIKDALPNPSSSDSVSHPAPPFIDSQFIDSQVPISHGRTLSEMQGHAPSAFNLPCRWLFTPTTFIPIFVTKF